MKKTNPFFKKLDTICEQTLGNFGYLITGSYLLNMEGIIDRDINDVDILVSSEEDMELLTSILEDYEVNTKEVNTKESNTKDLNFCEDSRNDTLKSVFTICIDAETIKVEIYLKEDIKRNLISYVKNNKDVVSFHITEIYAEKKKYILAQFSDKRLTPPNYLIVNKHLSDMENIDRWLSKQD